MADNDIEILSNKVIYNRTVSSNVSGINAYYNFDNWGTITYSSTAKRLFQVIAVQSTHPAGGQYYSVSSYYIATGNAYSGGWQEQFVESNATSGQGTSTSIGCFRTGSTYHSALAENYSAGTYYVAWQLGMGGSGTANSNWNGWGIEITSYP